MKYKFVGEFDVEFAQPEWSETEEPCFRYLDEMYYLSDFILTEKMYVLATSAFTGIGIKYNEDTEKILVFEIGQ